jgi:hypothetical protein
MCPETQKWLVADAVIVNPSRHTIRFMTGDGLQLSRVDRLCAVIRHVRHVVPAIVGAPGVIVNDHNGVCCW